MALIPHVAGESSIWVDVTGDGFEELGISVDGVTFKETLTKEPIMIDTYFKQPYDYQYSLVDAVITCDLVVWDATVLASLKSRLAGVTQGVAGPAGDLIVLNENYISLLIKSSPAGTGVTGVEPCWNFPQAFLDDAYEAKFGTEHTKYKLIFRAMWSQQLSTTTGAVLWTTACS